MRRAGAPSNTHNTPLELAGISALIDGTLHRLWRFKLLAEALRGMCSGPQAATVSCALQSFCAEHCALLKSTGRLTRCAARLPVGIRREGTPGKGAVRAHHQGL